MIKNCIQKKSCLLALSSLGALFLCGCTHSVTVYNNTYDDPQIFLQGIYDADHQVDPPSANYPIRAVIVPHHLTATRSIAAGMVMLKNQHFKKILLLSPDHFGKCLTILCTTNSVYHTFFGDVAADPDTLAALSPSRILTFQPDLFKNEHGIYAVLPYIAHYFPQVPVTPLVLSQKASWKAETGALLQTISNAIDSDTLLIVSSDFSHYLSLSKANSMDEATAEVLFDADLPGIAHLKNPDQSDCPDCLWALASLARQRNFYNPSTIFHTNSAVLLNNKSVQQTTSHFTMVWYQNAALSSADLTVAGDVTMTRVVKTPRLSAAMKKIWDGNGLRLVNLEGPVEETCDTHRLMFDFCNSLALWKGMLGLATHWGIMNNHMLDNHAAGIEETKRLIAATGETAVSDQMVDAGKTRFIAVTALMNPVLDAQSITIPSSYTNVLAALARKDPSKLTVVLVHAGKEYQALTSDTENAYLRSFIDAGADVVVAAHTHVVSDMEVYKGKPIFRGVGNFIFDQPDAVTTSTGKAVRLKKLNDEVQFQSFIERI